MELTNRQSSDYAQLFRNYVGSSIEAVHNAASTLDTDGFALAIQRITNVAYISLSSKEMWQQTCQLILSFNPRIERIGYWIEWMSLLEQATIRGQQYGDDEAVAELSLSLGRLQRLMANYDEARKWLQQAQSAFDTVGDRQGIARAIQRRAQNEQFAGDLQAAEKLAKEALKLFDDDDPERGGCYTVLATVAFVRTDWEQSERYYRQAVEARQMGDDKHMLAWAYADLGAALSGNEKYEGAISSFRRALSLFDSSQAPVQAAVFRLNLSAVYLHMEQPEPALELCLEIEPVFRRIMDERRLIMVDTNIGIANQQLHRWEEAEWALLEATQIARKRGFASLLTNSLDQMGLLYTDWGRTDDALARFDEAIAQIELIDSEDVRETYLSLIRGHREQVKPP